MLSTTNKEGIFIMKNKIIYKVIATLTISLFLASNVFGYSPRIDMQYKGGNKRHIGRYGFLIPLYEQQSNLLFTNMFFMHDSKSSLEGNFGLGFRKKFQGDFILGTYGFWDIRRIKNVSKRIHQATFGFEYMTSRFEARFNFYLPQNKRFLVKNLGIVEFTRNYDSSIGTNGETTQTIGRGNRYEIPLPGVDFEVGGNILQRLEIFGAYYHFNGRKGAKAVNGFRFRTAFYLYHWLDLEVEANHDNVRKWSNYAGFRFTWSFAKGNKPVKNSVNDKMTQLAVRDIDIISSDTTLVNKDITKTDNFSGLVLTDDDIKALIGASTGGNALFYNMDAFENRSSKRASDVNRMVTMKVDDNSGITFLALIENDNSVDPVVTKKLVVLFKDKAQADRVLSTTVVKNALKKSLDAGELDGQKTNFIGLVATDAKDKDDKDVWEAEFNKLLRGDSNGKLASPSLFGGSVTAVYRSDAYPIPLFITDPTVSRNVGIPQVQINLKLPKSFLDKLPATVKDTLVANGVDINTEVDIFYITQTIANGANQPTYGNHPAGLQAGLRIHPYVHTDAPKDSATAYNRTNYFKAYVIKPSDSALISLVGNGTSNAAKSVYTHTVGASSPNIEPNMRWSPPGMYLPNSTYTVTNLDGSGFTTQETADNIISVAIRENVPGESLVPPPLGKKAVVTWHQIVSGGFSNQLQLHYNDFNYRNNPKKLIEVFNNINSSPRTNNTNGDLDRLKNFARLADIGFENSKFIYQKM